MNRTACHKCGSLAWFHRCTRCSKRFCAACYDEHVLTHEEPAPLFGLEEDRQEGQEERGEAGAGDEPRETGSP